VSDFHQRGVICTLSRLRDQPLAHLENDLLVNALNQPPALVLPSTWEDFSRPPFQQILDALRDASWISQIVVSLNRASASEAHLAFQKLKAQEDRRLVLLWNDDPALTKLLPPGSSGKGLNLWAAIGWLIGEGHARTLITHDTDILNYQRELPARLALPLLHPELGYSFVKGYYPRISGQLFGRVTRLFVGPLLRALVRVEGHSPLLDFLESFRYPLAGEFGAGLKELEKIALPAGWDLEMDLLCSVHRRLPPEKVAQVDLGANYEHKHQPAGSGLAPSGLTRLAAEIWQSLRHNLQREGLRMTPDFIQALVSAYYKLASEAVTRYHHVSIANGLTYSIGQEKALVAEFGQVLLTESPSVPPALPAWAELASTDPERHALLQKTLLTQRPTHESN